MLRLREFVFVFYLHREGLGLFVRLSLLLRKPTHGASRSLIPNPSRSPGTVQAIVRCIGQCAGCSYARGNVKGTGVLTVIGELEPAGMAQHVRMDWEGHLGGLAEPAHRAPKPDGTHWAPHARS